MVQTGFQGQHAATIPGVPSTPQSPVASLAPVSLFQPATTAANQGVTPETIFPQPTLSGNEAHLSVVPYLGERSSKLKYLITG